MCTFGQNAASHQIIGLLTVLVGSVVAATDANPRMVHVALGFAILGLGQYVFAGHAPIYGWFLWFHSIRDRVRPRR